MDFPAKLAALRKQQGLTQQQLADLVGVHVIHFARYEKGLSQPTLDIIRKLAVALAVTADELIFDRNERSPAQDFLLQFEAIANFSDEERFVVKSLLDALILKHQARKWAGSNAPAPVNLNKSPKSNKSNLSPPLKKSKSKSNLKSKSKS
jgi:transcriptional regulator with XRE-family HTH domain